ncbi:sigma-70 family RNA polymerase sigma factor [bacterium]|nr:sigma-70 family RNA polymerase sigma factor [candidate division CSSED10-310 bacterium]
MTMATAQWDESCLVAACLRGEEPAFSELVCRFQSKVHTVAARFLGERDDIEEVAQDVFLAVFRGLPRFAGRASLGTWIYRITVNHCLNRRKKRWFRLRRLTRSLHDASGENAPSPGIDRIVSPRPNPEAVVLSRERIEHLSAALAALPSKFRMALILRDIEGLEYMEMADVLGISVGTVKSRLNRGRTRLMRLLEEAEA